MNNKCSTNKKQEKTFFHLGASRMETDKATIPNLYAVPANRKFHRLYNIKILCRLWKKIIGMCVLFSLHFEL